MLKFSLLTAVSSLFILSSCIKCDKPEQDRFTEEVSTEEVQIQLPSSGFEINEIVTPTTSTDDYYTAGIIEYTSNGEVAATVDFGNGEENSKASLIQSQLESEFELKKNYCTFYGKASKYKKVIVRPLVKTDDCKYIVAGIIKYYDVKSGAWTATVDFGDGDCDDIAVKTTAEGDYTFKVSEYYK
jgi:hypothetical protein